MKKLVILLPILLTACASSPKPMPDPLYTRLAGITAAMDVCLDADLVTPEEVGQEHTNVSYFLNSWSYDPQKFEDRIVSIKQSAQNDHIDGQKLVRICKAAKIRLYEDSKAVQNDLRMRQIKAQQDAEAYQQMNQTIQNMTPKTTYCNSVGTQVMCSTY